MHAFFCVCHCHSSSTAPFNKIVRWMLASTGMLMMYIGWNDLFDYYVGRPSTLRNVLFVVVGAAGVVATNTLEHVAYIYSQATVDEDVVTPLRPVWRRLAEHLRAHVALASISAVWLGAWNLMHLDR